MVYAITSVIEFVSTVILFFSSVLFILVLYSFFRGIKIPLFWLYFSGAFYILTLQNALAAYFLQEEPYLLLNQMMRLVSNVLILLGINELYRRFQHQV